MPGSERVQLSDFRFDLAAGEQYSGASRCFWPTFRSARGCVFAGCAGPV